MNNSIAKFTKVMAYIASIGWFIMILIQKQFLGTYNPFYTFLDLIFSLIYPLIVFTILRGFAEIIELLEMLVNKED